MASNKKLGKGLSSLLGNKADLNMDNKKDNGLLLIPIEKIFRDENQPRKEFDKEKIEELAQSINKNGLEKMCNDIWNHLREIYND